MSGRVTRASLLSAVVLLSLAAAACRQGGGVGGLEPVEPPGDLATLEPVIREQFDAFDRAVREPGAERSPLALGAAYGRLGSWYQVYQYYPQAESCYANAERLAPAEPRWPYYRGHVLRLLNRPDEARAAFGRTLDKLPGYVPALVLSAELELDAARLDAAEKLFDAAIAQQPESPRAHAGLAKVALERRRFEVAREHAERALAWDFDAPELQHLMGLALRGLGEGERAEVYLARSKKARPGDRLPLRDPLMNELAQLEIGAKSTAEKARKAADAGRLAEAVELFREAIAAAPSWPYLRLQFGAVLEQVGRLEGAIQQVESALALDPSNALAHLRLGRLYQRTADAAASEKHYRAALAVDPDQIEANFELARLLEGQGELEEALGFDQRAVELGPAQPELRRHRARGLIALGRRDEARRVLQDDVASFPQDEPLRRLLEQLQ